MTANDPILDDAPGWARVIYEGMIGSADNPGMFERMTRR